MKRWFVLVLAIAFLTVSCAADPRNQADADATRLQSQQTALDAEQKRAQEQAAWKLAQTEKEQESAIKIQAWNTALPWLYFFGSFCLVAVMLSITFSISRASYGLSNVVVYAAMVRARQIPVDPITLTLPVIMSTDGLFVTDLNTKNGMSTAEKSDPNALLVASLRSRLELGMQDYQAAQSKNGSRVMVQKVEANNE
jgi:hypothetical protein